MKTTIDTKTFRDAISKSNTIRYNKQLPILSYAKLECVDGKAKLTTTDLECAVDVLFDAKSDESFSVLLPRKRTQIFLNGQNGQLSVEKENGHFMIKRSDIGRMDFQHQKVEDFPPIPKPSDNVRWSSLDAKWFIQMVKILLTAVATEISRPVLTGVATSDGAMASTDGFRLVAIKNEKFSFGLNGKKAIIPAYTLTLATRLFAKENAINICFDGSHNSDGTINLDRVYFKSDNILLTSQLIQGNFPNWEQLIPKSFNCKASFPTPLMAQRLKMIDPKSLASGITRFQFQRNENKEPICLISSKIESDDDIESWYSMSMPVNIETQEEARIAFNIKYIQDALKYFSLATFELTSPSSPCKVTGDIEGLTIVVMPMFVEW